MLTKLYVSFFYEDLSEQNWQTLKQRNPSWNEVDLRDNR